MPFDLAIDFGNLCSVLLDHAVDISNLAVDASNLCSLHLDLVIERLDFIRKISILLFERINLLTKVV